MKRSLLFLALLVACGTVALDQISKRTILSTFQPGEVRPVIDGLFNLTLTFNRGAAFGLWSGLSSGWREAVLALTILGALVVVAYLMTRSYYQTVLAQTSLAAVLGGAIGNVIDRVKFGAVVDFLDFYVGSYHWPAFNVADSAICVGVALLILLPTAPQKQGESNTPLEEGQGSV
jgi:signal peptidase II